MSDKIFISLNNNVICKPHPLSGGLKGELKSGVMFAKQKVDVVPLEVLETSRIIEGQQVTVIPAGAVVYIREERLQTLPWGKQVQHLKGNEVILVPGNEIVGADFDSEDDAE
jgi:hypothetical protein